MTWEDWQLAKRKRKLRKPRVVIRYRSVKSTKRAKAATRNLSVHGYSFRNIAEKMAYLRSLIRR